MASGDGYTHRYDEVTKELKNIKRVIDDTLLYATDLDEAFKQMGEYLTLVGRNGIVLNPEKFVFGGRLGWGKNCQEWSKTISGTC